MDHAGAILLRDGVLMLGFALAFVLLFRRFGLGATLGYLLAGVTVGPHALGLVGGAEAMIGVAEVGIVMLLFVVGLELAQARLWRLKEAIFGLGLAQVVLCGLAVTGLILLTGSFRWRRPWPSACRWVCLRRRRCCRCCKAPAGCARHLAKRLLPY